MPFFVAEKIEKIRRNTEVVMKISIMEVSKSGNIRPSNELHGADT